MSTSKALWTWHQSKETIDKEQQVLTTLREQEQALHTDIAKLEAKMATLPPNGTQEAEINKLLLEQERYMASKELERFLERNQEKIIQLENSLSEHQFEVMQLEAELDEETLAKYYQLVEYKSQPIVEVRNKSCMGCFIPLSMSNYDKWRRGKGLVTCDECERILA